MRRALTVSSLLLLVLGSAAAWALAPGAAVARHGVAAGFVRDHGGWCQGRLTAHWRRVITHHIVPLSRKISLDPFALTPDGRSFFAVAREPGFSGVAKVGISASVVTKIKAFPDPNTDGAGGSFDDRWLVWKEYHGFSGLDDFTVYAWDSHTGLVSRIGASAKAPNGQFWASPWRDPDVRNGIATWAQGSGPDGLTKVHLFDLRADKGRIIHTGHAEGPFLLDHALVAWPESPARGAYVRMYVASTRTGKATAVPRALRVLRGISALHTDGHQVAYPNANFKSLWWSPSLARKPSEILAARHDDHIDNSVQIGGRYIGFGIQPHIFIADTKTHRYLEIEHQYGLTEVNAASFLVDFGNNTKKQLDFRPHIALIPLRDLPRIPACS